MFLLTPGHPCRAGSPILHRDDSIVFGFYQPGPRRKPIPSMPCGSRPFHGRSRFGTAEITGRSTSCILDALLIAAGLVTQSLRNLEGQHFGFVTGRRLIVNIAPSLSGYTPDNLTDFNQPA